MFIREKAYENAIEKVRIEFGTLIGEKADADAYIVLKELPTLEMMELNKAQEKGQEDLMLFFHNVLPKIIVEHNLYETATTLMTNEAVVDFIFEKMDVTSKVISEYANAAFFTRLSKNGDK